MTRIAIVATSEKLRAALAAALRSNPEFELVGVGATSAEVPPSADVVLIARTSSPSRISGRTTERTNDTVLSNREREILALLADGLGLPIERVRAWGFVVAVLSEVWTAEGGEPVGGQPLDVALLLEN